ncbi:MAG TPA: right-handed parallel beta-helix repeat-containing protein [Alphaproteobacteria bacterium]|nr:right-handed parallel beta-helix repeat-containing protein [Alphaproteobacteria bacterium]
MKINEQKRRNIVGLLACVWVMYITAGTGFAQDANSDRISKIRDQMNATDTRMVNQADITTLRSDLNNAMDAIVTRIQTLEKDMVDMKSRIRVLEARTAPSAAVITVPAASPAAPAPQAPPPAAAARAGLKMNVSMCASGCDAMKFSDAVALLGEGGTLTVEPGTYFDCIVIKKSMKLVGKIAQDGSRAHLKKIACSGKGAVDVKAPEVTIQGLKISEITVPDKNGACIRISAHTGKVLIKDIICLKSENGILGAPNKKNGILTIEDSTFEGHGKNGRAHGLYINGGSEAILRNVKILASDNGHLLKTGARSTLVENSVIAALGGNSGAAINNYSGGKLTVRNNVIQLGPNTQNHNFLTYADEPDRITPGGVHEMLIENNWFIYDDPKRCCHWLFSKRSNILDKFEVRNNKFVGHVDPVVAGVDMRLNKEYDDRDAAGLRNYDGTLESLPKPGS